MNEKYSRNSQIFDKLEERERLEYEKINGTPSASMARSRYHAKVAEHIWFRKMIHSLPDVEVTPVVHGQWEPYGLIPWTGMAGRYQCTACKRTCLEPTEFCPHCGALMDQGVYAE